MQRRKTGIKKIGWGFGGCNMHCRHCYNASGRAFDRLAAHELETVADRIGRSGVTDVNFGTGEFILNPDAVAAARLLKSRYPEVKLGLTTNGWSVVAMTGPELKNLFHDIDISIDFPDRERHNGFRRHRRAWDWATAALRRCQEFDIDRSIVTCVTAETTDRDLIGLLRLAKANGAGLRLNWFRPTGRGGQELCLTPLRYWQIIKLLSERAIFAGLSDPLLKAVLRPGGDFTPCGCGWTSARIQPDLTVTPCVFLKGPKWSAGSILASSIAELRISRPFRALRHRYPKACRSCPYRIACRGGCYSRAALQAGSAGAVDPFCPFLDPAIEPLLAHIRRSLTVRETAKVHHGYLCTLIIESRSGGTSVNSP